jgi:serine/threonine-protein kinase RsbW
MHGTPYDHLLRPGWRAAVVTMNGPRPRFHRLLPAQVSTPTLVRQEFREWLEPLHWPEQARNDLVLAMNEAVSNAVEHAYPPGRGGYVNVEAALVVGPSEAQRVIATVVDHGRWREPPGEPQFRRRGLQIMRAVTDEFRLDVGPDGTRVTLISPPVRPATSPALSVPSDEPHHRRYDSGRQGQTRPID